MKAKRKVVEFINGVNSIISDYELLEHRLKRFEGIEKENKKLLKQNAELSSHNRALQLLAVHSTHEFCSQCGGVGGFEYGVECEVCPDCGGVGTIEKV